MTAPPSLPGPSANLLIVGAEVLAAKVTDANGPFLLAGLRALGVGVRELRVVGDDVAAIATAVHTLAAEADFLITTGGIGPTHDDVTLAGVAAALQLPLVPHAELGQPQMPLTAANRHLLQVPAGTQIVWNEARTFPIVHIRNIFVLPGVPEFVRHCLPRLAPLLGGRPFFGRALHLQVDETEVAQLLTTLQAAFPDVAIGSYPRFDLDAPYRVRLTLDGRDAARVAAAYAALCAEVPTAWLAANG